MKLSNQENRVMKHMTTHPIKNTDDEYYGHGTIHAMDSWQYCGVYRLSAVIHTLRKKGYDILTRDKKVTNQFGEPCTIGQYIYNAEPDQLVYKRTEHFGVAHGRG